MKENVIIELIAEPILEALEALEASGSMESLPAVPTIRLVWQGSQPVRIGDQELNEDLISQVESYLQEKVMESEHPTILH